MTGWLAFSEVFKVLTDHSPTPWQKALYNEFICGRERRSCNLPTGLGKTSVIHIWLIALATVPTRVPRRLVYVVNRRTVVDQATREAEMLRERLCRAPVLERRLKDLCALVTDTPLAISTLRGQFADNGEWHSDPSRPAIVIGTVDMIGSRLLFSGYGRGFRARPLHAAFLGQDVLLIHDEAHLEPAFQRLVEALSAEQKRQREHRAFQFMELTATSRSDNVSASAFSLTAADRSHPEVRKRLEARKWLTFRSVDEKEISGESTKLALKHKDSGAAVLVYLRKVEDVDAVRARLKKDNNQKVQALTGTLRGLERDRLAKKDPIFARFLPDSNRSENVTPESGTVYFVCTSAGEVGVNISADHLVCDLTPFDSMVQRFGRVNRFGDGDARIDVVHEGSPNRKKENDPYDASRWKTLNALEGLRKREDGRRDASLRALGELPARDTQDAFTPAPAILETSDILFDAWSLTSVRAELPGRPPVADWLHGVREWEPPETYVAWRREVAEIAGDFLLDRYPAQDLLDDYPLKPHELLRDRTDRVLKHLKLIANRAGDGPAWIVAPGGSVRVATLADIAKENERRTPEAGLANCTVILPPCVGGLAGGMLQGDREHDADDEYDVADEWYDEKDRRRRRRTWDDEEAPAGMRLVREIVLESSADGGDAQEDEVLERRAWRWYVTANADDSDAATWYSSGKQCLQKHLLLAERAARMIVSRLGLRKTEATAIVLAAKLHDLGKCRRLWQAGIGNDRYPQVVLSKSDNVRMAVNHHYRHEFGSLSDIVKDEDFQAQPPEVQDLVLHLVAAHHGRARPHFPAEEAYDPERPGHSWAELAGEAPRRFARMQRKYGRWGLAYLESLVRAADAIASQQKENEK